MKHFFSSMRMLVRTPLIYFSSLMFVLVCVLVPTNGVAEHIVLCISMYVRVMKTRKLFQRGIFMNVF